VRTATAGYTSRPWQTPEPEPVHVPQRSPADLAIRARWILPVEPAGQVLEEHALLVRGGRIVALVPSDQLAPGDALQVVDRPEHALIPGLVNAHTHAAMCLLRNLSASLGLDDWLRKLVWPLEARLVDEQFVADGTELAIAEMLLGGITCFADMYYFPEVAARVAAGAGIRAAIGLPMLEQPTTWAQDLDECLARSLRLSDEYRADPLIETLFCLHSPSATSDASLKRVRTLADQLQAQVMIHLLESSTERERVERKHGRGPFERLQDAGLVNDLLIAVHCVQANAHEIEALAVSGASVVHCPASNLRLASGIAPLAEMRLAGLNVGLGTDGAASNDSLDILGEARLAALLAAGVTRNAAVLTPHDALEMATLAGARALGLADRTGSLVTGKWADIACLRLTGPEATPHHDIAAAVVHAAGRSAVTDTWVAGRALVADGRLARMNASDVIERARRWVPRVLAATDAIAGQ
jgi:5-methylthioadenosine/S-adenosylhomocysteine deaminase